MASWYLHLPAELMDQSAMRREAVESKERAGETGSAEECGTVTDGSPVVVE